MAKTIESNPARVIRAGGRKASATSSRRGPRARVLHDVKRGVIEESHFADKMSAQTFFQKSNAALVDTFLLIGVKFESVLNPVKFDQKDITKLVPQLKTFLAGFLPLVLEDELPVGFPTDYRSHFSPRAREYISTRLSAKRNFLRKIRLASLLNYSKRLFPNLPRSMVDDKLATFKSFITSPDTDVLHERKLLEDSILSEVARLPRFVAHYDRPFVPTGSSCLEHTRAKGGIQETTRSFLKPLFDQYPWLDTLLNDEKIIDDEVMFTDMTPIWNQILEYLLDRAMTDYPVLSESWTPMEIAPAAIAEPLKVRIVTRSSWVLQLLKPIQEAWHSTMRRDPIYQLIGGTPVAMAIRPLRLEKGQKFVSGDYESATDRIHLHYTKFALHAMLDRTDFRFPKLACTEDLPSLVGWLRRLCEHSFTQIYIGSPDEMVQRGQMMGHILSFPLLCIINRSASVISIPRDRFMLVNGDDVLFAASKREYREWEMHTRHVGLKKSIGKNYYSNEIAMINSEVYTWDKSLGHLVRVPIPNVGLLGYLTDFVDKKGRQVTPWEQLSGILRDFWAGIEPRYQKSALELFRKRYPIMSGFPGSVYGPTELGCMGLPVPEGHEFTRYQRIWMEAHRRGVYSYREGLHTAYSRIESFYQKEIPKQDSYLEWGIPNLDGKYMDTPVVPLDYVPDPYSRSGGYSRILMQIRRWFEKPDSQKHWKIFGRRRFNRFIKKNPLPPLSGSALENVQQNSWSYHRPHWFHTVLKSGRLQAMLEDFLSNHARVQSEELTERPQALHDAEWSGREAALII